MIIKKTSLFEGIDPEVMEEIVNIASEENYVKDTVIFERGQKAEHLHILEEGTVRLIIKNGGTIVFSLTEPYEVFGWSSMFDPGLYTASAVCATDLKVVRIEREKLDRIFDLHPDVGITILRRLGSVISNRLSNAYRDLLSARGKDTTPSYG